MACHKILIYEVSSKKPIVMTCEGMQCRASVTEHRDRRGLILLGGLICAELHLHYLYLFIFNTHVLYSCIIYLAIIISMDFIEYILFCYLYYLSYHFVYNQYFVLI